MMHELRHRSGGISLLGGLGMIDQNDDIRIPGRVVRASMACAVGVAGQ